MMVFKFVCQNFFYYMKFNLINKKGYEARGFEPQKEFGLDKQH